MAQKSFSVGKISALLSLGHPP